jgi:CRISPR-associated endoribonuclease Cas6
MPKISYIKNTLRDFRFLTLSFIIKPVGTIYLGTDEETEGDKWRSGMEQAFKANECTMKHVDNCAGCTAENPCLYRPYFETTKPRPFVVRPALDKKTEYNNNELINLDLVLIGRSIAHSYRFIKAMERLGHMGIGRGRGRFSVVDVKTGLLQQAGDFFKTRQRGDSQYIIDLLSPLKIKEADTGIRYKDLPFPVFFRNLLNRILNLNYLYCDGAEFDREKGDPEKAELLRISETIRAEGNLHWEDFGRFSSRQKESLKIGGLTGEFKISGNIEKLYPYLRIGEQIGAGQNTVSGFGRFEVRRK